MTNIDAKMSFRTRGVDLSVGLMIIEIAIEFTMSSFLVKNCRHVYLKTLQSLPKEDTIMRRTKKLGSIFLIMMILALNIQAMASAYNVTVYLEPDQIWSDRIDHPGPRSGNYSYVEVTCHSVYPESGLDTYSKMQARVSNMYGQNISLPYTIKEGDGANQISILEGYLGTTNIYYEFRGNSRFSAYATVSYDDK